MVSNLLSNAFKFTPEKGRVTVEMTVVQQSNEQIELKISVANTGKGIPPEQLPHIFDRFYSQPQESAAMQSSGIGLALTKELVELHGGTIQAASEPHQRTVFTFTLPLLLAKAATTELAPPPPAAVFAEAEAPEMPQTTNSRHPIVLLVEDNPDLRAYIKEQLVNHYQILEAVHGKQGLDLAIAHIPDLVLTDVMMPEMNGMELCQMLKTDERTSHVPVVMLTARSDQQDKISGLSTGADAYLTKPFDAEELQIVVHNLIEQRRKLREKFAVDFGASPATAPSLDFVSPAEDAFLKKVTAAVKARLDDENFSIENLGETVGMSRSQLHRKLKAITDQSPSVFVRTLRLQHAYHLLQQRAGNISEVAFQVGIPNLAYFSRSFSEQYGFPPSTLLHEGES
jgi:DNA-binding response OmpR family regulator